MAAKNQNEIARAYCEWLFMEHRLASLELGMMDGEGRALTPSATFAHPFHFPADGRWQDVPKPSTRAAKVLAAVGVMEVEKPAMADPMIEAIQAHRAWNAAYVAAPFDDPRRTPREAELDWLAANPDPAGDLLAAAPPMPTTLEGALAAIRYVIEDDDFVQDEHGLMLKQALAYLEGKV